MNERPPTIAEVREQALEGISQVRSRLDDLSGALSEVSHDISALDIATPARVTNMVVRDHGLWENALGETTLIDLDQLGRIALGDEPPPNGETPPTYIARIEHIVAHAIEVATPANSSLGTLNRALKRVRMLLAVCEQVRDEGARDGDTEAAVRAMEQIDRLREPIEREAANNGELDNTTLETVLRASQQLERARRRVPLSEGLIVERISAMQGWLEANGIPIPGRRESE